MIIRHLNIASNGANFLYSVFVIDRHYMEPNPTAFFTGIVYGWTEPHSASSPESCGLGFEPHKARLALVASPRGAWRGPHSLLGRDKEMEICWSLLRPSDFSQNHASAAGIEVFSPVSHTLF